MAYIVKNNSNIGKSLTIQSYSEPLSAQKETTSFADTYSIPYGIDTYAVGDIDKYVVDMVGRWRSMARNSYVSFAIDDIVNEIVASNSTDNNIVQMNVSSSGFSKQIQTKIIEEYNYILKLLDFGFKSFSLVEDWYIDGRICFKIEKDQSGIKKVIQLDPLKVKKTISKNTETGESKVVYKYYQGIGESSIVLFEFPEDEYIEVNSGKMDDQHRMWTSYLNDSYVALNQLTSIEDSIVIYRIARAPERRVFYVDVGELPKSKAEAYLKDVIRGCKTDMQYDAKTGVLKEKTKHASVLEDIYLPRRDGSRGTEVTTLQGGQNLSNLEDLDYFLQKLFRSLYVPYSRFSDASGVANAIGRTSEITRDEAKYAKFISRLRQQFTMLFFELLKMQLSLKNVASEEEIESEKQNIEFVWSSDNMFFEFKELDIMTERINGYNNFMPLVGKCVSFNWIRRNVLHQTDEDIEKMDKEIAQENKDGTYKKINPEEGM